jgi:hypothetical protein
MACAAGEETIKMKATARTNATEAQQFKAELILWSLSLRRRND